MRIGRKFTTWIISIMLIAMAASVSIFSWFELKEEEKKLEMFSKMTGGLIQESIVSAMLERKPERLREKLLGIKKRAGVIDNIWLLNRSGIVQSSTDQTLAGKSPLILEQEASRWAPQQAAFLKEQKMYRVFQAVPNDLRCHKCHGSQAKYNGMIVVDFSVSGILEHVHKEIYGATVIMLIVLLSTGAAVLVLWKVLVGRRLNSVVYKVRLVKEGSYHSHQGPGGKDEFARLEQNFNEMAEAIQARNLEKEKLLEQLSLANADLLREIGMRKQGEEALEEQLKFLRILMDTIPMPVFYKDLLGAYQGGNKAFENYIGRPKEDLIGKTVYNVAPKELADEYFRRDSELFENPGIQIYDYSVRHADGTRHDVIFNKATFTDSSGKVAGLIGVMQDITERKRAEDVIRRNYDTQTAINRILHISLENISLEEILRQALDLILSIPWLSFQSRGAIFLIESGKLTMKTERGLSDFIKKECSTVPFGKCLCGRAAAQGELEFSGDIDERHENRYLEMNPHGHYCVPIKLGSTVLGVINIYLKEGHQRDQKEMEFLGAIANALAGIIKRNRAEAALQESEKRYRTLAEAAQDVIFIAGADGTVTYVNSFGADLFRRCVQELTGKKLSELFPSAITERLRKNLGTVLESGRSIYVENPFTFGKGETWLGTWLVPLKDGEGAVDSVLGVARDITERRHSEQVREKLIRDLQNALNMITRSHKEWQDTFDSIMDMIAIIDKDFNIIKANRAFSAYFGLEPREVVHKKCYHFQHEIDGPIPSCPHVKTIQEKKAFSEEMVDKKTNKTLRITTFPYLSPEGDLLGSIHIARDITDEKEREARLIMSERLAALGQMASGIAHEINNPLASIAGCSEGLLSRVQKGTCDYTLFETYLNIIQEEIFRCKSITTAMLSFVRKTTYETKDVKINEMLDRTLEIISFQGRLKNISIQKKYKGAPPLVQANEGELRQVFLAVITNALDAMKDQGTLAVETGTNPKGVYARIIDSGAGIAAENLTRIFDPFYTTKSETGGTGLGLSIARKIMHNHNGTIEVESEPGKGSIFTISLPAFYRRRRKQRLLLRAKS